MLKSVPGTSDLFAQNPEYAFREPVFRHITEKASQVLAASGAQMLHTPIFEYAEVFQKGVGATSDIVVKKEMYTFLDRGDRLLALRPEPTAAIVRAYNQHGMKVWPQPVRLYTYGPIFRAERQQKGRYKQFHQVDYEALGSSDPLLDAESIGLMVQVLQAIGLKDFEVKLGSVGDPQDRLDYNRYLREQLSPFQSALSPDSQSRLESNPMRILDSKEERDQNILRQLKLKPLLEFLGPAARGFHQQVAAYLDAAGIPYTVDPSIVRGLDYYVRTAWEVHHGQIGAKSALGGGGRYDGLSEMLGGKPLPGVGFGMGIERLAIALEQEGVPIIASNSSQVYVVPLDEAAKAEAFQLVQRLRPAVGAEMSYTVRKPAKAFEEATKRNVRYVVFLGQSERDKGVLSLKDLQSGLQQELSQSDLVALLQEGGDPRVL